MNNILLRLTSFWPDNLYLKCMYRYHMHNKLNLNSPQTFNEKLQWLKINDRNPQYTNMVDKVAAKDYVASMIGEKYIIPTFGVWNDPDEIDFDKLPNSFVIKCAHNSGTGMCICRDKSTLDYAEVKDRLRKGLKEDYFKYSREWPYKHVPRRIIAEAYLEDMCHSLNDYKVLCFGGVPKLIELHMDRFTDHQTQDFYDTEWNITNITQNNSSGAFASSNIVVEKPANFELMLKLSEKLSEGIPHVRIDWYSFNNKLYFGEMTFYDGSGFEAFDDIKDDVLLGSYIDTSKAYCFKKTERINIKCQRK